MPTDLLRYLSGPTPYAAWSWIAAALLVALIVGWYAAVYVWTLPPTTLRSIRGVSAVHRRLLARRFARTVAATTGRYRAGAVDAAAACAGYSATLRRFLRVATGQPVQYLHNYELAGPLAAAAPLIDALDHARFNTARIEVEQFGASVEEMIRSWT